MFSSLETSSDLTSNLLKIFVVILTIVLIIVAIFYGCLLFLNIDIIKIIQDFFAQKRRIAVTTTNDASTNPVLPATTNDASANPVLPATTKDASSNPILPATSSKDEVFHIPGNTYTYSDADAVCSAYGSKLAGYQELESAYNKGADWCSYGWSDNQMAFFPTQQASWDKLQKIKGHENDCGRPGINGGYIDSPGVKFGVNCYGHKPKITPQEATVMKTETLYPKSQKEHDFNKSVDYWRKKIDSILVAPFNKQVWALY